ncbi:hypothetical protein V7O66_06565 [Methanolobus sp. ZRKC3]|uniref:hypothetical protein n=1 Tax=Methanolobus sp. ZRKC3 TaxID=3125786 RepID=UPI00324B9880
MINLNDLKIPASYESGIVAKKVITTIPVRKPKKTEFFRIRPEPEWCVDLAIADMMDGEDERYLVMPEFYPELEAFGVLKPVRIYTAITYTTNVLFLTDVGLPDVEGKHNEYHRSRMEAYEVAKTNWVKIMADMSLGAYIRYEPATQLDDPDWPEEPVNLEAAINIAFKGRIIDSNDHPVLKRLRGEV